MQDIVFERFKTRIKDLGLSIDKIDEDELIHISQGSIELKISLDNVRKSYEQEGTFDHLDNLIDSIQDHLIEEPIPGWNEASNKVYFSLFPSDYDFGDFLNEKVTNDFHKYYVYNNKDRYIWINYTQLKEWEIDEQVFKQQVEMNMNTLLSESSIEILETENHEKLAYFESPIAWLKSALLFSKNLKEKASPTLGWPIYCVLPVRDFCFMFSETDKNLVNLLDQTVLDEYRDSPYPITTEVLRISDEGIETMGKYKE
jgi:hypothetical protein